MTTLDTIQNTVRSARRVDSIPLLVVGAAVVVIALSYLVGRDFEVSLFIAPVTSFLLWLALKSTASRAGLGMGRERYGLITLIFVLVSTFLLLPQLLGPAFLLGALLFTVGWRAQNRRQWMSGAGLAVASPLLSYWFLQNVLSRLETVVFGAYWPTNMSLDDVVLGLLGVVLLVWGVRAWRRESALLRRPAS